MSTDNTTHEDIDKLTAQIEVASQPFRQLVDEVGKVIVGQETLISRLLVGLLGNGHLLIEGVPGLAKTTAVASLAKGISTGFQRLQFTPDLLPADLRTPRPVPLSDVSTPSTTLLRLFRL